MKTKVLILSLILFTLTACTTPPQRDNTSSPKTHSNDVANTQVDKSESEISETTSELQDIGLKLTHPDTAIISKDPRDEPDQTVFHISLEKYTLTITKDPDFIKNGTGLMLDGLTQPTNEESITIGKNEYIKKSFSVDSPETAGLTDTQVDNPKNIYGGTIFLTKKQNNTPSLGLTFGGKNIYNLTYNSKFITKSNETIIEIKLYPDPTTELHKKTIKSLDKIVKSIQLID
jgi:hypothetical protein